MIYKDLLQIYAYARLLWPTTFKLPNSELEASLHDQLWFNMLQNFELGFIITCMQLLAKESDFCSVAKISKKCDELLDIKNKPEENENDIFAEVYNYITRHIKTYEELSSIAKRIIGSNTYAWRMSDMNDFETVICSNIRRAIRNELEQKQRVKEYQKALELQNKINNKQIATFGLQNLIDKKEEDNEKN